MSLRSLVSRGRRRGGKSRTRRPWRHVPYRPVLEALEYRWAPAIIITESGGSTSVAENAIPANGQDTYTISVDSPVLPTQDVVINLTILSPPDNDQIAATPTTVTFTATDWFNAQTITVTAKDDPNPESDLNTARIINTSNGVQSFASSDPGTPNVKTLSVRIDDNDNTLPVAVDDLDNPAFVVNEDNTLTTTASVLDNDTDADNPESDPNANLTAVLARRTSNGKLTLNDDGTFIYKPDLNFNGEDFFEYYAYDRYDNSTETAQVKITVNPINDPPIAADDAKTIAEDVTTTFASSEFTDNDDTGALNESDTLTITDVAVSGNTHGTVSLGANTITYDPADNYNGQATFDYTVCDREAPTTSCDIGRVTITLTPVNDAPTAVPDFYTVVEEGLVSVPLGAPCDGAPDRVLCNDSDVDGDPIRAILTATPTNGSLAFNNSDGSFQYRPDPGFSGEDTLKYKITDMTAESGVVTVTFTVNPVDDLVNAIDDVVTMLEDNVRDIAVLNNDKDSAGNPIESHGDRPLTVSFVTQPSNGTATKNTDNTITYVPTANSNEDLDGPDTFTYRVCDVDGDCDNAAVNITVEAVNDIPDAINDSITLDEESINSALNVLANDTGLGDRNFTLSIQTAPTHGTAVVVGSPGETPRILYTPNKDFNTSRGDTESLVYQICDSALSHPSECDTATATLTVRQVDDVPIATDDFTNTVEEMAVDIPVLNNDILGNDPKVGDQPITITVSTPPAASQGTAEVNPDNSITFTPATDFQSVATFEYQIRDGFGPAVDIGKVTITVGDRNDPPVALNDAYSVLEGRTLTVSAADGVLANDSDPDPNNTITATDLTLGAGFQGAVTLSPNGSFTYSPPPPGDFSGSIFFTYNAEDAGELKSETPGIVYLTVIPLNDAPVATDPGQQNGDEDTDLPISLVTDDVDTGSQDFYIAAEPRHGNLSLGTVNCTTQGAGSRCTVTATYDPDLNYNGADSFVFRSRDDSLASDNITVPINVRSVNDLPVATDDAKTAYEDLVLDFPASHLVVNDTDADGNTLTVTDVTGATNGSVVLDAGRIRFTPAQNFSGEGSFAYTVSDGTDTDTATVTVTVRPVNDQPFGTNDEYVTPEDTPLIVMDGCGSVKDVLCNDVDSDGPQPLKAQKVTDPVHGTVSLSENGSFTYMPHAAYEGPDSFTYRAFDNELHSQTVTVSITVGSPMAAPMTMMSSGSAITNSDLRPVVQQAIAHWSVSYPNAAGSLSAVSVRITDLPGSYVGFSGGNVVLIDQDAAGFGWSTGASVEAGRMDLLSAVTHEFGHALGLEHHDHDVMLPVLEPGVRLVGSAESSLLGDIALWSRPADSFDLLPTTGSREDERSESTLALAPSSALTSVIDPAMPVLSTSEVDAVFAAEHNWYSNLSPEVEQSLAESLPQ